MELCGSKPHPYVEMSSFLLLLFRSIDKIFSKIFIVAQNGTKMPHETEYKAKQGLPCEKGPLSFSRLTQILFVIKPKIIKAQR